MMTTNAGSTRLSVSAMRRYAACGYAFKLHREGVPRRIGAAVWYGGLMHRIIQRAYAGAALVDAHEQVWTEECGSVFVALEGWSDLHAEMEASGNARTKARQTWLDSHPRYHELAEQLAQYQADVLSIYRWPKTASLGAYFLQSRTVVREHGDALLLPHAVMVEGAFRGVLPSGSEFVLDTSLADDDEEPRSYRLLDATIGATTVIGVPDVVTYDPDTDIWRIGDYKTSRIVLTPEVIREDVQLNVYLIMLHQCGMIPDRANVMLGQIYLSDRVEAVWVDASDLVARVPHRLVQQVEHTRTLIEAGVFMPVKGLLNGYADRCAGCMFAEQCDA